MVSLIQSTCTQLRKGNSIYAQKVMRSPWQIQQKVMELSSHAHSLPWDSSSHIFYLQKKKERSIISTCSRIKLRTRMQYEDIWLEDMKKEERSIKRSHQGKLPRLKLWVKTIWKRSILTKGGICKLSVFMTPAITCLRSC